MNDLSNNITRSKAYGLNNINLVGTISGEAVFSHEVVRKGKPDGEKMTFRRFTVEVQRLSGVADFLEVVVSEKTWLEFVDSHEYIHGEADKKAFVEISGRLQSYNHINQETGKNKLDLFVYAKQVHCAATTTKENDSDNAGASTHDNRESTNTVAIEGFVCKEPVIRQTHSGRTIADLFIAVNHRRGSSSYIPAILWGGNAVNAKNFKIGDKLRLTGRFQSREFVKDVNGTPVNCMAYEMSASRAKPLDEATFVHC